MLHLAGHGRHPGDNPLFSAVELADGPWFGYDIDQLPHTPATVVLSACELGRASVRSGEEVVGMTAAWLHAGARCVTSSPALVADDVACEVLAGWHARVAEGEAPADALADAAGDLDATRRRRRSSASAPAGSRLAPRESLSDPTYQPPGPAPTWSRGIRSGVSESGDPTHRRAGSGPADSQALVRSIASPGVFNRRTVPCCALEGFARRLRLDVGQQRRDPPTGRLPVLRRLGVHAEEHHIRVLRTVGEPGLDDGVPHLLDQARSSTSVALPATDSQSDDPSKDRFTRGARRGRRPGRWTAR